MLLLSLWSSAMTACVCLTVSVVEFHAFFVVVPDSLIFLIAENLPVSRDSLTILSCPLKIHGALVHGLSSFGHDSTSL